MRRFLVLTLPAVNGQLTRWPPCLHEGNTVRIGREGKLVLVNIAS
jgi:hypothetical protein